jgi:coproporphyrinogen III oxidase
MSGFFNNVEKYVSELQIKICDAIEKLDGKKFTSDKWDMRSGGGGVTKVLSNGNVFEKCGINFSSIHGKMNQEIANQLNIEPQEFSVCGVSLIMHPFSPKIPTIHMNIRFFELEKGKTWFGGGTDLTPYYPYEEDFKHFHKTLKKACNSAIENSYDIYKKNCDEYFFIKHRNEMRGIGGVFFDYIEGNKNNFSLVKSLGDSFLDSYLPIVEKRKYEKFTKEDKKFQLVRRGRYVEFNLIYDRGTLFGLKSGGRIESVLVSLPSEVSFIYNYVPKMNSPHSKMEKYYQPRDWSE